MNTSNRVGGPAKMHGERNAGWQSELVNSLRCGEIRCFIPGNGRVPANANESKKAGESDGPLNESKACVCTAENVADIWVCLMARQMERELCPRRRESIAKGDVAVCYTFTQRTF